jgi:hypothetical protein
MQIPNGLSMMLKAFGIEIPEPTLQQINELIPQLPAKVPQALELINGLDRRLQNIEAGLSILIAQQQKDEYARRNQHHDPDTGTTGTTGTPNGGL